jgi:hypothetical protein
LKIIIVYNFYKSWNNERYIYIYTIKNELVLIECIGALRVKPNTIVLVRKTYSRPTVHHSSWCVWFALSSHILYTGRLCNVRRPRCALSAAFRFRCDEHHLTARFIHYFRATHNAKVARSRRSIRRRSPRNKT